jgi:hypothetical protein
MVILLSKVLMLVRIKRLLGLFGFLGLLSLLLMLVALSLSVGALEYTQYSYTFRYTYLCQDFYCFLGFSLGFPRMLSGFSLGFLGRIFSAFSLGFPRVLQVFSGFSILTQLAPLYFSLFLVRTLITLIALITLMSLKFRQGVQGYRLAQSAG